MGSDNLFYKRKTGKLVRGNKVKQILPFILIVCEGAKTEPNYFNWYKNNCKQTINIEISGQGKNTRSLVEATIKIKKKIQKEQNIVFDQVWCIFDKDSFSSDIYNSAFQLCRNSNIEVAYSNECFEVWYLLHFNYYNCGMDRTTVFEMLDEKMKSDFGRKYEKNMNEIYDLLAPKQDDAIRNAKRLESSCRNAYEVHHQNPSTSVYKLVEELNKYKI